jgi:hypothetical protein
MTPEMLQQVAKLVRAQAVPGGDGESAATQPQTIKEGDGRVELPLDQDERGYGEF